MNITISEQAWNQLKLIAKERVLTPISCLEDIINDAFQQTKRRDSKWNISYCHRHS